MAVDSATLATASGILKEVYQPGIVSQINIPNAFWAEIEKKTKDIIEGKYAVIALRMGLSQAIGARGELGILPTAQRTLVVQAKIPLKFLYGVIRASGPLLESAQSDRASFIRAMRSESEGIVDAMKLDLQRMLYGNGSGLQTATGITVASTTIVLNAEANMLYFEIGALVDIRTMSTGALVANGASREVIGKDDVNKTITLDAAGGVVTTSVLEGIYRAGNLNNELNGLSNIVDDTLALHGVDPATAGYERWKSRVNSSMGSLTLAKLQQEIDYTHDRSGEWVNFLYSNGDVRSLYLNILTATRQFWSQESTKQLNGGFKGLAYTGGGEEAAWVKDPFAPAKTIYGLNMKHLFLDRLRDFEFVEVGGTTWLPDIYGASAVDAYKAVLAMYGEIICDKRNAHFKALGVIA